MESFLLKGGLFRDLKGVEGKGSPNFPKNPKFLTFGFNFGLPHVVYFDQRTGAPHDIRWSKLTSSRLSLVFLAKKIKNALNKQQPQSQFTTRMHDNPVITNMFSQDNEILLTRYNKKCSL